MSPNQAHHRRPTVRPEPPHPRQREFQFHEHAGVWTSLPADVRRRVVEIIRELLRAVMQRRREVQRSEE
jgi:hypothetical protein